MQALTARQQQILDFIRERIDSDAVSPSLAEIAEAFGFADPSSAQHFVAALVTKGALLREPGKRRNLRLVDAAHRGGERSSWRDGSQIGNDVGNDSGLRIPLIGRVAAGQPILAQEHVERSLLIDPDLFRPRADFVLRVQGDSMRDAGILDGDWVAVQRSAEARSGQIVVARLDDEVTLKRLKKVRDGIELWPENPAYSVIQVDPHKHHFAIEGIQVGLIRNRR
ncbi:MAG: transcriptional repressor LexA [Dokdonella sp.]